MAGEKSAAVTTIDSTTGPETFGDCETAVDDCVNSYVNYLELDITKENASLDEFIEQMLTRLDEFCGLVDLIRCDTSLCINETIPKIQIKSMQLKNTFEKIDKLEEFVNKVKADLSIVEEQVNKAESEIGSLSIFKKKMLNAIHLPSFMRKSNMPPVRVDKFKYEPPTIFCSDDYFGAQPIKKRSKSLPDRPKSEDYDSVSNNDHKTSS